MREVILAICLFVVLLFPVAATAQDEGAQRPSEALSVQNTLTDAQKEAGWKLLFDGKTTQGWRGFKQKGMPAQGWVVEDGCLRVVASGKGGDVMTVGQYGEFDLSLDFKVSKGANSGIMFLVSEHEKSTWRTGPEYQILDDVGHKLAPGNEHSVGALYGLCKPPAHKPVKPAGEWNRARIIIRDRMLQHWLNGVLLVECDLDGEDWEGRVERSKFKPYPLFGRNLKGHLALQDHGHDIWFRNIRIRDLTPKTDRKPIPLFNGRDLSGWGCHFKGEGKMADTWSVDEGVLVCKGQPIGYIFTEKNYRDFILRLQWRFNPVTKKAGNSGVLLRQAGDHKVWPRCLEAQLHSGSAGDFWVIDNFPVTVAPERTKGRNTKKTHFNEHAVGEWNEYEITVKGGSVRLVVNGELLNEATEAAHVAGRICLQSEGAEIHFRDIILIPLDGKKSAR